LSNPSTASQPRAIVSIFKKGPKALTKGVLAPPITTARRVFLLETRLVVLVALVVFFFDVVMRNSLFFLGVIHP
jgi:hypothetical protein